VISLMLGCTCLLLAILLVAAFHRMNEMNTEVIGAEHTDHAKCIAHVAHYVGNEFAAQVLYAAAKDFDTMDGQAEVRTIAQTKWQEGDPSVPALWMIDRADLLLGLEDAELADVRNYQGERMF